MINFYVKDSEYNVEVVGWCIVIGFYMLRFMTLGTKINRKYRNLSTLITEQVCTDDVINFIYLNNTNILNFIHFNFMFSFSTEKFIEKT